MIVMSYGGGKQTVAIITMVLQDKLPRPDVLVMADTGYEVKSTFEYLEAFVQPALKQIGLSVTVISHEYSNWGITFGDTPETEAIILPAFTRKNGRIGKMPTFCSNEWKQRPVRRWLRERGINDADLWLGISTDEAERMKASGLQWLRHVYPLIEIIPTSRNRCISQIQAFGWPLPEKSRCKICPNQSPAEWKALKRRADGDFFEAVTVEREIRQRDEHLYFHPLAIPLDQAVERSELQTDMFDGCDSGFCFT